MQLKPWIDRELQEIIRIKQLWYSKWKKARRNSYHPYDVNKIKIEYDFWNNKYNAMRPWKKKMYMQNRLPTNTSDTKQLWKGINCVLNDGVIKPTPVIKLIADDKLVHDNKMVADILNKYFVSVGHELTNSFSHTGCTITNQPADILYPFHLSPTNKTEVEEVIRGLKNTASVGIDGLSTKLLKFCNAEISTQIASLINTSFRDGIFPEVLKKSKIIPVYKKGDRSKPSNYRPIAINSVLSKIFETIFKKRLNTFLESNNIVCREQYGFRNSSNTNIALYDLCTTIQDHMHSKNKTAAVFLDLQKAFDSVDIEILAEKLKNYGLNLNGLNWIKSFLSNRYQCVNVGDNNSEFLQINCGVPQGSILGPVLFLLYINDITNMKLRGKPFLFADDVGLVYGTNNTIDLEAAINNDMTLISNWLKNNKIFLNVAKTKYILFQKNITINVCFEGKIIEEVETFNYLGIIIDKRMKFNEHALVLEKRLCSLVGVFRRISKYLSNDMRRTIYYSMFNSLIIYGISIWGSVNKTKLADIQVLQNKAIKSLYRRNRLERTASLHQELQIQLISKVYQHNLVTMTHNIINKFIHTNTVFAFNFSNHQYSTRTSSHLHVANLHPNSIKYNSITAYNKLPDTLKNTAKQRFKNKALEYI